MIKKIVFILLIPVILISQTDLSLQQAVERTLQNNYNILMVKKDLQIADNNISYGNAGFLPTLDAAASYRFSAEDSETKTSQGTFPGNDNQVTNRSASLSMGWTLFDGFAMFARYDKFEELEKLNKIALQLEIETRLQELFNTYYQINMLDKSIKLLEETLKFSQDRLNFLNASNEYGATTGTEVLRAEVDFNTDNSNLKRQEVQKNAALNRLKYIMGEVNDTQYNLTSNLDFSDISDYNSLKEMAFERNSNIQQAMKNREISEYDEKIIEAAYYPNIRLNTGYSYSVQESDKGFILESSNQGYNATLSASWNLFSGFQTRIADQNTEILQEKQDLFIQSIRAVIEMNLMTNYQSYSNLKEILDLEIRNLETANENFERSKSMFKYGTINSIDLRQSQINLLATEQRIVNLKYEIKTFETMILMLSGQLGR
ncbi:MAG: TolC family protein [Ignavibacteriae bacterium]|nr:TolC family protein [Ignavibacteriota bacterium]